MYDDYPLFQARSSIKTDDDFKAAFHLSTALTQAMLSYRLNDVSVSWSYVCTYMHMYSVCLCPYKGSYILGTPLDHSLLFHCSFYPLY